MKGKGDIKNILFDLDGTIVDSYEGIQSAYNYAFEQIYHRASEHNILSLIGSPIKEILIKLEGERNECKIDSFVRNFQEKYDLEFYKNCEPYVGVEELLNSLSTKHLDLYIATNKRLIPTSLVLEHLKFSHYFKKVYAKDSNGNVYESKVEMVAGLISDEGLDISETMLIGDTTHDFNAAKKNKIRFIYAGYGYGDLTKVEPTVQHSLDILNLIN